MPVLYPAVARRSFRRFATYRAATAAGVVANTAFGFVIAYTYLALWNVHPHLGGYDAASAVTFVWLSQALLAPTAVWGGGFQDELEERIRTGDVAVDLYRPVDFQGWWLANDLGRAGYELLARGVPPMLIGVLCFPLRMPRGGFGPALLTWTAFLLSVLLAVVVSFGLRYLAALSTFWLLDPRGVRQMMAIFGMFLSGKLLPITLFPPALVTVARATPWPAVGQVPIDVFLQRPSGAGLTAALGEQALWAVLLLAAGRLLQGAATRRVVVQGG
jgi:ABC-2 type transport system permease protein